MPSHLHLAERIASKGQKVHPCDATTKAPRCAGGHNSASTDPSQLRHWFGSTDHMVGIPTSGFVVVDLDVGPNGTFESYDWWVEIAGRRGWLPGDTPMASTPSGGRHIWYRAPEGHPIRCSVSKLAPGIDVRARGGYAIAPGSINADGLTYQWLPGSTKRFAPCPPWLTTLLVTRPMLPGERRTSWDGTAPDSTMPINDTSVYGEVALESECAELSKAVVSTRNHTLNNAAFRMGQLVVAGELNHAEACDALYSTAREIGLEHDETLKTIRSGLLAGLRNPRRSADV